MSMVIAGTSVKMCMDPVSDKTLRIAVLPAGESVLDVFSSYDLAARAWGEPSTATADGGEFHFGKFEVRLTASPIRAEILYGGKHLQTLDFCFDTGVVSFPTGSGPLFGLGHGYKTRMERRGHNYDLRVNGQVKGIMENYSATSPTPYVISAEGWALFFHQPWKGTIDLSGAEGVFQKHPAAYCDVFVVACGEPLDAPREYYAFTGLPPMPPKYAFGFQQSYRTLAHNGKNYVLETARWLREHEIPCDVLIYLGTGYCDNGWNTYNGNFEFHPEVFPEPEKTMRELHDMHYKISLHVTRCFTGLHGSVRDESYISPLEYDHAKNYWKRHVDEIYAIAENEVWWPDDADEVDMEQRLNRHRMYYEGSLELNPDVRPFQMQRNTFPGANKWGGIIWSGDVNSEWETLKNQVPIGLNVALSSSPYWGTDTGGFFSTPEFDGELFMRWVEYSALTPFFRFHGRPSFLHNPWGWEMFTSLDEMPLELNPTVPRDGPPSAQLPDKRVELLCKKYINLRYELLPTLYTLSHEATGGIPMMRPLWCYWPEDETAVKTDTQYMLGDSLMVAPVTAKGADEWDVYLPAGVWYDYWTGQRVDGGTRTVAAPLETIPLFVKAGGFLAKAPVVQYVDTSPKDDFDPLVIEVYAGADGAYTLYEDDGISLGYERGECSITTFVWEEKTGRLSAMGRSAIFPGKSREIEVVVRPEGVRQTLTVRYD